MLSFDVVRSSAFHVLTLSTVAGVLFVGDMAQAALIHHYQAEGNPDDSVGTDHGVEAGGVSYAPSVVHNVFGDLGQAFSFSGEADSNIDTNEITIPEFGPRTIAFLVASGQDQSKAYNNSSLHVPLSQGHRSKGLAFQFGAYNTPNMVYCCRSAGEGSVIESYESNDLFWHHVAVTYSGDNTLLNRVYLDGVLASVHSIDGAGEGTSETEWISPSSSNENTLRFGTDDEFENRTFHGLLDDIRIYDEELPAQQIAILADFLPPPDAIKFEWVNAGSGDWNDPFNWTNAAFGAPPDNSGESAVFGDKITTLQTVFTNTDVTVNDVQFDNSATYIVAGNGTVRLSAGNDPDLPPSGVTVAQGSHQFQTAVQLNDDVTVDIAAGASLEFINRLTLNGNTLTQSGDGTLLVNNSFNTGAGTIMINSGVIGGGGTIGGDVNNSGGTVAPSNSGILTIEGGFTQGANGTLAFELGGLVSGVDHDHLVIFGAADLNGTLEVTLKDDFTPNNGDTFDLLDFDTSVSGNFSDFILPGGIANWDITNLTVDGSIVCIGIGSCGGGGVVLPSGDFNASNLVDSEDLNLVLFNWNEVGSNLPADWAHQRPGDAEVVGIDQLNLVLFNWNEMGSSTAAVPEPASFILVGLALLVLPLVSRRR